VKAEDEEMQFNATSMDRYPSDRLLLAKNNMVRVEFHSYPRLLPLVFSLSHERLGVCVRERLFSFSFHFLIVVIGVSSSSILVQRPIQHGEEARERKGEEEGSSRSSSSTRSSAAAGTIQCGSIIAAGDNSSLADLYQGNNYLYYGLETGR
jgi:hypothetical protein